jgi:hypothetical protein
MIVALETLRKEDTIKRSQAVILRPVEASCAFETGKAMPSFPLSLAQQVTTSSILIGPIL